MYGTLPSLDRYQKGAKDSHANFGDMPDKEDLRSLTGLAASPRGFRETQIVSGFRPRSGKSTAVWVVFLHPFATNTLPLNTGCACG